jgi:O-acetyl-ADP-ribose deacetylase (regulator of RNase III)
MFNLHFVSLNKVWIEEILTLFDKEPNINITFGHIESIDYGNSLHVFVSPCNSLGQMNGGIDAIYSELFPDCETLVRNRIAMLPTKTALGRSYLDIGAAIVVPLEAQQTALIVAPTMFYPENVSDTMNALTSFLAALLMMEKYTKNKPDLYTLVVTSHCCGIGGMNPETSAQQMYLAWQEFVLGARESAETHDCSDIVTIQH